jgi:hypothetical protein
MTRGLQKGYVALASIALAWAVGNSLYVYLVLDGARSFRLESAVFLLVALLLPFILLRPASGSCSSLLTATDARLLVTVTVGLWLAVIIPFLRLPFLSDDYVFLATYRHVSDLLDVRHFLRPVFAIVFLWLARVADGSPVPFHVLSLLIHATSAWFVYVLSRRLFGRTDAAVLCFALFLLNPLQLEAVLWASGLQELLWTVFALAALVVYTGRQLLSLTQLAVTVLLLVFALLSKETAISTIVLLPAADWLFFRAKRGRLLAVAYLGFGVTAAAYLLARTQISPVESDYFVAPGRYFVQKFLATPYKFFAQPWNLVATQIPAIVRCGASVGALAVLFLAAMRGTGRRALAGPTVILVSTLPVYAYFYVASDLQSSRYLYFAAVGWAVLVAQMLTTVLASRHGLLATSVCVVVLSSVSLQLNTRPWRTAADIVGAVATDIKAGRSVESSSAELSRKYGDGLEIRNGIPAVYNGVYLFLNGYRELQLLESTRTPSQH